MTLDELEAAVIQWAEDKGLLTDITDQRIEAQTLKVLEETGETAAAQLKQDNLKFVDGIGDMAVTLLILAKMRNTELKDVDLGYIERPTLIHFVGCIAAIVPEYLGTAYCLLQRFATYHSLDFKSCLEIAYNEIADRKGKMFNNTFVKD